MLDFLICDCKIGYYFSIFYDWFLCNKIEAVIGSIAVSICVLSPMLMDDD